MELIKRDGVNVQELKPGMVSLSGLEKYTPLLEGVPFTAGMRSGYVTLEPGEAVGEHKTSGSEEAIIVLEGKASVYCENKMIFTAEGESLIYIPPDKYHDIKNESKKKLRYVYVVTSISQEERR